MPGFKLHQEALIRHPRDAVFEFLASAENLNALTPPWVHFSILTPLPIEMAVGTIIDYRIRIRGVPVRWLSEITEWDPPAGFCDVQRKGPYRVWAHRHTFEEVDGGTLVTDSVDYRVPGGALVNRLFVAGELRRIFGYRKARPSSADSRPNPHALRRTA